LLSRELRSSSKATPETAEQEHGEDLKDLDHESDTAENSEYSFEPTAQPLLQSSLSFNVRFASMKLLSPWFPEVDPKNPRAQTWRTFRSQRDILLMSCCTIAGTVLVVNFAATVAFKTWWKTTGDLGRIYKGDCTTSQRLSLGLHIIINILSTLLFSSSNLCMQLLVSPTREEVDRAHKNWQWLDIGVPSIRNLRSIALERRIVWVILGLSSVPLHFL
jgi:hypothetical protein